MSGKPRIPKGKSRSLDKSRILCYNPVCNKFVTNVIKLHKSSYECNTISII